MSVHISSYFSTLCQNVHNTEHTGALSLSPPFCVASFQASSVCISLHLCLMTSIDPCTPIHLAPSSTQTTSLSAVGVSEGGHCQVVFEKHFSPSTLLKGKIGGPGKISWLSSKNNPRHKCLFFVRCIFPSTSWFIRSVWPSCGEIWGGSMAELGIAEKSGNARLGTRRTLICSSQISLSATWTHQACHVIIWYTLWALMFCQLLLSELSDKFTEDADVVVQRSFYLH